MMLTIFLIFTVVALKFVSAGSEHVDFKPNCDSKTISCSCMKSARRNGFQLNVTVKSCTRDRNEDRKTLCSGKCRKAYFALRRQRRNAVTQNLICRNGTIKPLDSSSSIKARPNVHINGLSRDLSQGTDVTFKCTVVSTLAANVTWLFNGVPIMEQKNSSHRHNFLACWTVLHIKMVSTKDAGNYTCVVQNAIGQATASSRLSVYNRKEKGPYISYLGLDDNSGANTAIIGSSVNMTCKTQNPAVQNAFEKNGFEVKEGDGMHYTLYHIEDVEGNTKVAKLEIKNITFDDAGNYTCLAFLDDIIKSSTFELKVVYPRDENAPQKDKEAFTSPITSSEIIGIVFGVIGALALVTVLILFCVKKRTLWPSPYKTRSISTKQLDLPSTPSELIETKRDVNGSCGKTNDTQYSRVVKKPPEVDCEVKYDVFICYSSKDLTWVRELLAELENRQFVCCIDYRDFIPGPPIVENITQAIYHSRKTIAVLSPDFLDSEWCKEELQRALTRIRSHQVVPVMYRNCAVPLVLQDRTYLDWENCDVKPYFWTQLEAALKLPNDCEVDYFDVNTIDPLLSCET